MSSPFDSAQGKPAPDASDPVDAYLERLDQLLTTRASAPPPASGEEAAAGPAERAAVSGPDLVAEAFAALLALEEGAPGARPVRLVTGDVEPRVTEALVEELTRRIIERLAPDAVRAVVADVVSDVAERLVREEIERIRNTHA